MSKAKPVELVSVVQGGDIGSDATLDDLEAYCDTTQAWINENESEKLSLHVRPARKGEVSGLRYLRGGMPYGPEIRDANDDIEAEAIDLLQRAWDLWCSCAIPPSGDDQSEK